MGPVWGSDKIKSQCYKLSAIVEEIRRINYVRDNVIEAEKSCTQLVPILASSTLNLLLEPNGLQSHFFTENI